MSEIIRKNGNGRYSEAVIKDGILYVSAFPCSCGEY